MMVSWAIPIHHGKLQQRATCGSCFSWRRKAFDNVWHNELRYKIFQLDLLTKMTRWFKHINNASDLFLSTALFRQLSPRTRLRNKFIWLALRLPKYICPTLLHDSAGIPYVKDRLFSCASKTLDRIAQNPLVEESISSNKLNPAWDRFPTPLSAVRPASL